MIAFEHAQAAPRLHVPQPQGATHTELLARAAKRHFLPRLAPLGDQQVRMVQQPVSLRGKSDITAQTVEQPHPKDALELFNAGADGCLGEVQGLCRIAKVPGAVDLEEGT